MLLPAIAGFGAAKEKAKAPNAYRMEMLDVDGKPVATAIIWTPKFEFRERPFYTAKCKLTILQGKSKEDAVVTFNQIIPKPGELVELEIQSFPNESPDTPPEKTPIRLCVNFNPGAHDWNVKAVIDQSKDGFDASWYCELAASPKWGGDVKITRIFAEQAGTGQPATRPESKSEGSDKPQPEAEGRSR